MARTRLPEISAAWRRRRRALRMAPPTRKRPRNRWRKCPRDCASWWSSSSTERGGTPARETRGRAAGEPGLGSGVGRGAHGARFCRRVLWLRFSDLGARGGADRPGLFLLLFQRGAHERGEERMRLERLGFEFRMELAAQKPRVLGRFDDLDVVFVRSAASDAE